MPEPVAEIPNRPAFRAAEVCEIAQIPPYVLKSWEKEFPRLGVAAKPGGPRVYRRADVEQVLRIKHLLFAEGHTLAGARRKLEGEGQAEEEPFPDLGAIGEVRSRVAGIKKELRSLLEMLSADRASSPRAPSEAPPVESAERLSANASPAGLEPGPPVQDTTATPAEPDVVVGEPDRGTPESSWPPPARLGVLHGEEEPLAPAAAASAAPAGEASAAQADAPAAQADAPSDPGFLLDGAAAHTSPNPPRRRRRRT